MSTLTEKIAATLEAHVFDKPIGRCRCNAEMSTTGHRTREHRAHLAGLTAAVVAEWLESGGGTTYLDHDCPDCGSGTQVACVPGCASLTALAAEAVKGAGQ